VIAFYRALLRLYPASFRAQYGEELCAIFAEEVTRGSRMRMMARAIADVVPNALAAHLDILRQDLHYAMRTLRRAPGFAFTAILLVALGVGANTAAFSLADFVLLRPLPLPDSERLMRIWTATDQYSQNEVSPAIYRDWKAMATKSFTAMGAYSPGAANLAGLAVPHRVQTARVTVDLMPLLGVRPLLGSAIAPANSARGKTAVLSYDLWRSQFGGAPDVIGRVVRLDGAPHTIIGVMPSVFRFPNREVQLWTALIFEPRDFDDRTDTYLEVMARLRPNATLESARAELAVISSRLQQLYPDPNEKVRASVVRMRDQVGQRSRLLLIALCGAALCVLLLACANLATLLLARGAHRSRELAIRTALGAGRERLLRQLVTETVLLAIIGGVAGIALAWSGLPLLAQLVPTSLPIQEVPQLDLRVLAFAAALVGVTGLAFGVIPALRTNVIAGRQRLRSALVVLEVTGSIVLLISSGLLVRSILRIQEIDPGFRVEGVTTMRTALPLPRYGATAARERFFHRVLDEVRAIPGIESAAYATGLPMERTGGIWRVDVAGTKLRDNSVSLRYVTRGYFSTMSIPLRAGRDIADSDTGNHPYVAAVSESFARRYWPNESAIGRRFKVATSEWTIVGVVGDVRVRGLERSSEPQVYVPSGQVADNAIIGYIPQELVIRSTIAAENWLPAVRRVIAAADPEQPISHVRAMAEIVDGDTAPRRVQVRVLTILSAIALLIAAVGIHGLLSFAVVQRTKEFGIRRALGAEAGGIVAMVLGEGFRLVIAGTIIGIAIAIAVARAMRALLFGVAPTDARTVAIAVALCVVTTLIGCIRPALRAARVDPMVAIRET